MSVGVDAFELRSDMQPLELLVEEDRMESFRLMAVCWWPDEKHVEEEEEEEAIEAPEETEVILVGLVSTPESSVLKLWRPLELSASESTVNVWER